MSLPLTSSPHSEPIGGSQSHHQMPTDSHRPLEKGAQMSLSRNGYTPCPQILPYLFKQGRGLPQFIANHTESSLKSVSVKTFSSNLSLSTLLINYTSIHFNSECQFLTSGKNRWRLGQHRGESLVNRCLFCYLKGNNWSCPHEVFSSPIQEFGANQQISQVLAK